MNFEVHGYIETFHEIGANRTLGYRKIDAIPPGRKCGTEGQITVELVAPTTLSRGYKEQTFSASPQKPRKCYSTILPICGRML